jgi:hypothetical protein
MSVKKPLVITNGRVEQLQAGDRIDLGNTISKNNIDVGPVVVGQPMIVTGADAKTAHAGSASRISVAGLVMEDAAPATPVSIMAVGIMSASVAQWEAVTGNPAGLVTGKSYYLVADAPFPGKLQETAPTLDGQFIVHVGIALSSTQMKIQIEQPVLL